MWCYYSNSKYVSSSSTQSSVYWYTHRITVIPNVSPEKAECLKLKHGTSRTSYSKKMMRFYIRDTMRRAKLIKYNSKHRLYGRPEGDVVVCRAENYCTNTILNVEKSHEDFDVDFSGDVDFLFSKLRIVNKVSSL